MVSTRKSDFPDVERIIQDLTVARLEKAGVELEALGKTTDAAVNQLLRSLSLYGYRQPISRESRLTMRRKIKSLIVRYATWSTLNPKDIMNPIKFKLAAYRTRETGEAEEFLRSLDRAYKRARLAVSDPLTITYVVGWFNHKRSYAFGLLFTGSSIGGIVFPIMVSRLISEVGYGRAMRISAFLMLFLLVIANLTVRPYHPPHLQTATRAQLLKSFTEIKFLCTTVGFFFFSYGFFVTINYLPVEAYGVGMDPDLAQYVLPILNAASLFGRLFAGFLSDKIGRFNVFIVVCYMSGAWTLALWLPDTSDAALIAFAVLFGFFWGAYVSLITPLVMQISPMAEIGFRTGIVLFVSAIGGLTANPINGAMLESAGGWTGLKVFSGVFCLVGTTFVLVARIKRTGWKMFVNY
ncbi:hypothetical protein QQX98_001275 [Neonectria punicea]|uniref:Major facilitator superfamily (MFS) profile domain-containing protein n=1 Tax=Neonectria punicea TaxID=979145 RepID=A0ABR1HP33_9HYPO